MCKIISITEYVRNQQLKDDYLSEISFYTNKLISDKQKLYALRNLRFCPFKHVFIRKYESSIEHDKSCIEAFTKLYSNCNTDIVQVM